MSAEQVKKLVAAMPAPEPNERGILSKIDRNATLKAIAELHAGGEEHVRTLVEMLVEPGTGNDHQARYALHGLALYVCGLGGRLRNEEDRKSFSAALAKTLDGDRPAAVKEFVLRELQVCGGGEVVAAIGKCLGEAALVEAAAAALVTIGGDEAATQFRRLQQSANRGQRLIAVQSMGVLRDKQSVSALAKATDDDDGEIRTVACWALANIGDPAGIDACLTAAEKAQGYERIQAGKSRLLFAERLKDSRQADAKRLYEHLRRTSGDESELYLREIAERELAGLG
ncbi:MAG: HEAT repeat domain-containing protein [Pirellulales bacterium]